MMNKFAEQLKNLRNQKGLSQEVLAEQLNFSRQAISRWENGETSPDLDNLVKLASIFDVSLDELVIGVKSTPVVVEKADKNRPMNVWEFLADYWWIILPILGYIGWILGK